MKLSKYFALLVAAVATVCLHACDSDSGEGKVRYFPKWRLYEGKDALTGKKDGTGCIYQERHGDMEDTYRLTSCACPPKINFEVVSMKSKEFDYDLVNCIGTSCAKKGSGRFLDGDGNIHEITYVGFPRKMLYVISPIIGEPPGWKVSFEEKVLASFSSGKEIGLELKHKDGDTVTLRFNGNGFDAAVAKLRTISPGCP